MGVPGAQKVITTAMTAMQGVSVRPHRFGGCEYVLGTREIGHIHGDQLVDIPFPRKIRDDLVATGRAEPHHILPETGWVSFYLREADDIGQAIRLLEESYEIAQNQKSKR
jgi:hypothetical protein